MFQAGPLRLAVEPLLAREVGDVFIEARQDGLAIRSEHYGAGC